MAGITVITLIALTTFDKVTHAIHCPAVYFVIISLEGNFLTPMILGKRLLLNPVVIFLAIIFWGWIWGVPGALIAVPVVVIVKIVCDKIESLAAVGEILGK
ncbi:MAG TPA: AI-2E family transporter [Thermodesulfobacteriota bacterium]|nr:AI-2E family transporter [Thermodesulfobacteriota bacterium]